MAMSEWITADRNPTEEGTYLIAYIRDDGVQRQSRAFYRLKERKHYYKDEQGKASYRIKKAGWNLSKTARMKKLLAWRTLDGFEYTGE